MSNNLSYATFFKGGIPFGTIQDAAITASFSDWSNYCHSPIFLSSVRNTLVPEETTRMQREWGKEGRERQKGRSRGREYQRGHIHVKKGDWPTEPQLPKEIDILLQMAGICVLNFNAEFPKSGLDVSFKTTLRLQKHTALLKNLKLLVKTDLPQKHLRIKHLLVLFLKQ